MRTGNVEVTRNLIIPDCVDCPKPVCSVRCIGLNSAVSEMYVGIAGERKNIRHSGFQRCSLLRSTNQLIAKLTWTTITWDLEEYDIGDMHESVTNPGRATVAKDGNYGIKYQAELETSKDTQVETRILKNGSIVINGSCMVSPKDGFNMCINESHDFDLLANDYFVVQVYHDNAASKNLLATKSYLQVRRLF